MERKIYSALIIGIIGSILTIARRWGNKDSSAGGAVAGWTFILVVIILMD